MNDFILVGRLWMCWLALTVGLVCGVVSPVQAGSWVVEYCVATGRQHSEFHGSNYNNTESVVLRYDSAPWLYNENEQNAPTAARNVRLQGNQVKIGAGLEHSGYRETPFRAGTAHFSMTVTAHVVWKPNGGDLAQDPVPARLVILEHSHLEGVRSCQVPLGCEQ